MRRVLTPRWWVLHVVVLAVVAGMLRLGLWQWHRAESSSGGLQNYAYAFQWPVFAAFGIFLWIRTLHEETRRTGSRRDLARPMPTTGAPIVHQPGVRVGLSTTVPTVSEDEDAEVAARNAVLAALNAASAAAESRRR